MELSIHLGSKDWFKILIKFTPFMTFQQSVSNNKCKFHQCFEYKMCSCPPFLTLILLPVMAKHPTKWWDWFISEKKVIKSFLNEKNNIKVSKSPWKVVKISRMW